eukprot:351939-Rhodomonas_salina.1
MGVPDYLLTPAPLAAPPNDIKILFTEGRLVMSRDIHVTLGSEVPGVSLYQDLPGTSGALLREHSLLTRICNTATQCAQ